MFNSFAISRAGDIKLKKLAATITPAAKPKRASMRVLFTFLKKKTILAPKAVILQVKRQARKACNTGDKLLNESNIITPLVVGYANSVNSSGLKK